MPSSNTDDPILFDGSRLSIEDVVALAQQSRTARLSAAPEFRARIARGA